MHGDRGHILLELRSVGGLQIFVGRGILVQVGFRKLGAQRRIRGDEVSPLVPADEPVGRVRSGSGALDLFAGSDVVLILRAGDSAALRGYVVHFVDIADGQGTLLDRDVVVAGDIIIAVFDLHGGAHQVISAGVLAHTVDGDAADVIAVQQARDRHDLFRDHGGVGVGLVILAVLVPVVVVDLVLDRDSDGLLGDGQLAGGRGEGETGGDILVVAVKDLNRAVKAAVFIGADSLACRGFIAGDQNAVALRQTGDGVLSFHAAGDGAVDDVAALILTVVGQGLVGHHDAQRALGDRQIAEVLDLDSIVRLLGGIPSNLVGVLAGAGFRPAADGGDGGRLASHQAGELGGDLLALDLGGGTFQRRAVIGLGGAAGGDGEFLGQDLQTTGTDVDTDLIVRSVRQITVRQADIVCVIPYVLLGNTIVTQAGASLCGLALDDSPNIVQISGLIAVVGNHDIVRNALAGIGEAGLVFLAGIWRAGPAVWLDTDGDIDFAHLQRAAVVVNTVIVCTVLGAGEAGVARRNGADARVDAAIVRLVIGVGVTKRNGRKSHALGQTGCRRLAGDGRTQFQRRSVVQFTVAPGSNRNSFLIKQRELQAAGCRDFIRDLILVCCRSAAVAGADDCLVELPALDRRTRQGHRLADLEDLYVVVYIGNGIAVHIHEVDGNLGILEAGVFEDQDIFIRIRGKNQGLLHRVRIELKPGQFRMCCQESRIVHGSRALKAGGCIGRYIGHGLFRRHRDLVAGILRRIQDVFDRIAGDSRFRAVDKGDDVLGVV